MSGLTYGRQPGRKLLVDDPTAKTSEGEVSTPTHVNWHLAVDPDMFPSAAVQAPGALDRRQHEGAASRPTTTDTSSPQDNAEVMADPVAAQ